MKTPTEKLVAALHALANDIQSEDGVVGCRKRVHSIHKTESQGGQAVSDTPISDSTPHNVGDLGMLCRTLERLASVRLDYINQLEANHDAANAEIDRLAAKVAQLYEGAEEQKQRIKRLEEAGDALAYNHNPFTFIDWTKAKEDKL